MKKFAIFLPQFHEIEENNRWWGKGFTEWSNVKKAKSLYKGHEQPKIPLDNNYYNLLDESTVKWQEGLLKEYNIDGLIYYHYYFDGKKLLERPALNLLENKSINYKFFFCWPSEPWRKTWNGTSEILINQRYEEKYWEDHISYLLQFFKDERYEKKENKPLFMLHNTEEIRKHKDMIDYFDKRCKEEGFDGIGIIEVFRNGNFLEFKNNSLKQTIMIFLREPEIAYDVNKKKISQMPKHCFHAIKKRVLKKITVKSELMKRVLSRNVEKYNGNRFYEIMTKENIKDKNVVRGIFFEWDNTPRHSYRGYVILPPDKQHFDMFMEKVKGDEYLFINAWNEWAEGMILEPTVQNGYKYLKWLKEW